MAKGLIRQLAALWRSIRELSGDDAYERYLAHHAAHHVHAACHANAAPLSRKEFFARREEAKWGGVRRCC